MFFLYENRYFVGFYFSLFNLEIVLFSSKLQIFQILIYSCALELKKILLNIKNEVLLPKEICNLCLQNNCFAVSQLTFYFLV